MFSLVRVLTVETRKLDKRLLQGKTCHLLNKSTLKRPRATTVSVNCLDEKSYFLDSFFFKIVAGVLD